MVLEFFAQLFRELGGRIDKVSIEGLHMRLRAPTSAAATKKVASMRRERERDDLSRSERRRRGARAFEEGTEKHSGPNSKNFCKY